MGGAGGLEGGAWEEQEDLGWGKVLGFGFWVCALRFRVSGLGFRV